MATLKEDLLARIEDFCHDAAISERRFGLLALHSEPFVGRFRRGMDIKLGTAQRALDFMDSYFEQPQEPVS